jgi:hypothetical protein
VRGGARAMTPRPRALPLAVTGTAPAPGAGMCPGNDQSAGERRSVETTEGSAWPRLAPTQAA